MTIPETAFTVRFTAVADDIDELGHVNNAVWVRWVQDTSTSHWYARASEAEQAATFWVVVRHEIDYRRPLLEGESVTAFTWVAEEARGATFDRHIRFIGDDGTLHVSAKTTWAMLDRASGRPLRVRKELVERFRAG
jgi:acyl-CoA thioester hydrolase